MFGFPSVLAYAGQSTQIPHTHTHMLTHIHTHTCTFTCTHTHIHTHTHTHTHIYAHGVHVALVCTGALRLLNWDLPSSDALKLIVKHSSTADGEEHRLTWCPYVRQDEDGEEEEPTLILALSHGNDVSIILNTLANPQGHTLKTMCLMVLYVCA